MEKREGKCEESGGKKEDEGTSPLNLNGLKKKGTSTGQKMGVAAKLWGGGRNSYRGNQSRKRG